MFGYFYNRSIKRYATLMGALLNHIAVERINTDESIRYQKVPISFGGKERFIEKLDTINNSSDGDDTFAKIETILPRMNISLIDMMYSPTFKTNISNREIKTDRSTGSYSMQFNPVPYKFIFELSIFTRHEDDIFCIIEQILPYFQPNFTAKTTELHTNDLKIDRDIQITVQSMIIDPDYGGDRFTRRRCEASLMFELDGFLYPASTSQTGGIIKTIYVDFFANVQRLDHDNTFESVDKMTCPDSNVALEDWTGGIVTGMSSDTPIPSGIEPSGVRGTTSGDCKPNE